MRSTPSPLPPWIRSYRQPPYTNIYEVCPKETYLFGTESLYGDWDAELLILGQDVGPVDAFEKLRDAGHPRPFAHREFRPGFPHYDPSLGTGGAKTNQTVYQLAEHIGCAKLYGSVMIGLCRPGDKYSGTLPRPTLVREHCVRVLRWAMDPAQTPKLKAVMCLGTMAKDWAVRALRQPPVMGRSVRVYSTPHPTAWAQAGSYSTVLPVWRATADQMGWKFK
jgi:hypothetical protein